MKKILLFIILNILVFSTAYLEAHCANEGYKCDFDNMEELGMEWSMLGPETASMISIANDPENNRNHCLKIERCVSDESNYATSAVLKLTDSVITKDFSLSMRVYTDSNTKWYVPLDLYGYSGDKEYETSRLYFTRKSEITANEYEKQGEYTSGIWHDIMLQFDFENTRTTFYIDGTKIGTFKNLSVVDDIRRICFRTYDNNSFLYIDDIKLNCYDGLSLKKHYVYANDVAVFGTIDIFNDGLNPETISVIMAVKKDGMLMDVSKEEITVCVGAYQYELYLKTKNKLSDGDIVEVFFWNTEDNQLMPMMPKLQVEFDELNIIRVSDYGAIPGDNNDDGAAIYAAVQAASNIPANITVLFEEGEYLVSTGDYSSSTHIFDFHNIESVEVCGNNTMLTIEDSFLGALAFENSANVSISGISVDYEVVPWVQGTVQTINKECGYFLLSADEKFSSILLDERARDSIGFGMVMDAKNPYVLKEKASNHFNVKSIEYRDGLYEIYLAEDNLSMLVNEISLDDNIVINGRKGSKAIFSLNGCGNFDIKDCIVYASAGADIIALNHDGDLNILGLKNIRKDSRWIVANADGVHIQGIRGNLRIENSVFDGNSDDCVNIYQKPSYVTAVSEDMKTITLYKGSQIPRVGDTITIVEPVSGNIRCTTTVVSSSYCQGSSYYAEIELADEVRDICSGDSLDSADNVFIDELGGNTVKILNCDFINSRRYGLLLRSKDTIVDSCRFENLYSSALVIENDFSVFNEGLGGHDIIFSKNTVKNCSYSDYDKMNYAAIMIKSSSIDKNCLGKFHSDISLHDNIINTYAKHIIYISGAINIDLVGNTLANESEWISSSGASCIFVDKSENIKIKYNTFTDRRQNLTNVMTVGSNVINTEIEENTFDLSNSSICCEE